MARCLSLGALDNAGNYPLVDSGVYSGQTCVTVGLDPSEYQTWTSTSALLVGFDVPTALTIFVPILGLWSLAWVLSFLRR